MARHDRGHQSGDGAGGGVILYRWRGTSTNFGDELNTLLWPRLLPDFFDGDATALFLGIGSILDRRHADQPVKLVAGSGYGGYQARPRLDESWVIHWVRGPRTAAALGVPAALALGDPAVLVPTTLGATALGATTLGATTLGATLEGADGPAGRDIGFMPHFESAGWGAWQQAADLAGVRLIDPRAPPLVILRAIQACKLLLSEALHGVIVADAMRVPWIAIEPAARVHRPKWIDWAETMGLRPRFLGLPASTLLEFVGTSPLRALHPVRVWVEHRRPQPPGVVRERLLARASRALRQAAQAAPQLSTDGALDRCQSRMLDAVRVMHRNPLPGYSSLRVAAQPRSCLQPSDNSAYQLTLTG